MTPRIIGKIARMVSETSFTESSIPPIWAKLCVTESKRADKMKIDLFITVRFYKPEIGWLLKFCEIYYEKKSREENL